MDADLVGATGVELDFEESSLANPGANPPIGPSRAGMGEKTGTVRSHTGAVIGMTGNGKFNAAAIFR